MGLEAGLSNDLALVVWVPVERFCAPAIFHLRRLALRRAEVCPACLHPTGEQRLWKATPLGDSDATKLGFGRSALSNDAWPSPYPSVTGV